MRPYSVETNAESPEHIQQGRPSVWKDGPVCFMKMKKPNYLAFMAAL